MQPQTIQVLVRARPTFLGAENGPDEGFIKINEENSVISIIKDRKGQSDFAFSKVFGPSVKQNIIYSNCDVVSDVINGINCCIMAYGQTGSGKTYTMYGNGWEDSSDNGHASDTISIGSNKQPRGRRTADSIKNVVSELDSTLLSVADKESNDVNVVTARSTQSGHNMRSPTPLSLRRRAVTAAATVNDIGEESIVIVDDNDESLGIIPRAISDLFKVLEEKSASNDKFDYSVTCQIMQIYNEKIYDLMQDKRRENPLPLRDVTHLKEKRDSLSTAKNTPNNTLTAASMANYLAATNSSESNAINNSNNNNSEGNSKVYVRGLSVYRVYSKEEAVQLLKRGLRNRAVRATDFNSESSRSHTILQLFVTVEEPDNQGLMVLRRATLSLVDLAGSEKWRNSLNTSNGGGSTASSSSSTGGHNSSSNSLSGGTAASNTSNSIASVEAQVNAQVKEMTHINSSLHVLGNCVAALIEPNRRHIPYRDSTLTRLLQDPLGGNGRTIIIATIHADNCNNNNNVSTAIATHHREETYSTLQFASRASHIKVSLVANVGINEQANLVEAQRQIKLLRARLQEYQQQGNTAVENSNNTVTAAAVVDGVCIGCQRSDKLITALRAKVVELLKENKILRSSSNNSNNNAVAVQGRKKANASNHHQHHSSNANSHNQTPHISYHNNIDSYTTIAETEEESNRESKGNYYPAAAAAASSSSAVEKSATKKKKRKLKGSAAAAISNNSSPYSGNAEKQQQPQSTTKQQQQQRVGVHKSSQHLNNKYEYHRDDQTGDHDRKDLLDLIASNNMNNDSGGNINNKKHSLQQRKNLQYPTDHAAAASAVSNTNNQHQQLILPQLKNHTSTDTGIVRQYTNSASVTAAEALFAANLVLSSPPPKTAELLANSDDDDEGGGGSSYNTDDYSYNTDDAAVVGHSYCDNDPYYYDSADETHLNHSFSSIGSYQSNSKDPYKDKQSYYYNQQRQQPSSSSNKPSSVAATLLSPNLRNNAALVMPTATTNTTAVEKAKASASPVRINKLTTNITYSNGNHNTYDSTLYNDNTDIIPMMTSELVSGESKNSNNNMVVGGTLNRFSHENPVDDSGSNSNSSNMLITLANPINSFGKTTISPGSSSSTMQQQNALPLPKANNPVAGNANRLACAKHGLEQCVLCNMFGSSSSSSTGNNDNSIDIEMKHIEVDNSNGMMNSRNETTAPPTYASIASAVNNSNNISFSASTESVLYSPTNSNQNRNKEHNIATANTSVLPAESLESKQQQQPLQYHVVSAIATKGGGVCRKHGVDSCLLCSMTETKQQQQLQEQLIQPVNSNYNRINLNEAVGQQQQTQMRSNKDSNKNNILHNHHSNDNNSVQSVLDPILLIDDSSSTSNVGNRSILLNEFISTIDSPERNPASSYGFVNKYPKTTATNKASKSGLSSSSAGTETVIQNETATNPSYPLEHNHSHLQQYKNSNYPSNDNIKAEPMSSSDSKAITLCGSNVHNIQTLRQQQQNRDSTYVVAAATTTEAERGGGGRINNVINTTTINHNNNQLPLQYDIALQKQQQHELLQPNHSHHQQQYNKYSLQLQELQQHHQPSLQPQQQQISNQHNQLKNSYHIPSQLTQQQQQPQQPIVLQSQQQQQQLKNQQQHSQQQHYFYPPPRSSPSPLPFMQIPTTHNISEFNNYGFNNYNNGTAANIPGIADIGGGNGYRYNHNEPTAAAASRRVISSKTDEYIDMTMATAAVKSGVRKNNITYLNSEEEEGDVEDCDDNEDCDDSLYQQFPQSNRRNTIDDVVENGDKMKKKKKLKTVKKRGSAPKATAPSAVHHHVAGAGANAAAAAVYGGNSAVRRNQYSNNSSSVAAAVVQVQPKSTIAMKKK